MKLPIVAYGDPVLRKVCVSIDQDFPDLKKLISDMFDTMYAASGVGLAAPQVGIPIRLFIVDTGGDDEGNNGYKRFLSMQPSWKKQVNPGHLQKGV